MAIDKKLAAITLQILTSTLTDTDRLYVATSGNLDAYMTGATLKALASGNVSEVATFGALPGSAADGKLFLVVDASGDPDLSDATWALYVYRVSLVDYTRLNSLEEIAGANGDMLKSVYDTGDNGKVDGAEQADEISVTPAANQYWGTDSGGNQIWINNNASLAALSAVELIPTGSPLDNVNLAHVVGEYYFTVPHSNGLGTLETLTSPPDHRHPGLLRIDTGGTPSVAGPAFDITPVAITLIGGFYRTDFDKNTLEYSLVAGNLYGSWVESRYSQ
jgi:hypothetical protein